MHQFSFHGWRYRSLGILIETEVGEVDRNVWFLAEAI